VEVAKALGCGHTWALADTRRVMYGYETMYDRYNKLTNCKQNIQKRND